MPPPRDRPDPADELAVRRYLARVADPTGDPRLARADAALADTGDPLAAARLRQQRLDDARRAAAALEDAFVAAASRVASHHRLTGAALAASGVHPAVLARAGVPFAAAPPRRRAADRVRDALPTTPTAAADIAAAAGVTVDTARRSLDDLADAGLAVDATPPGRRPGEPRLWRRPADPSAPPTPAPRGPAGRGDTSRRVAAALTTTPATTREIADAAGVDPRRAGAALRRLAARGEASAVDPPHHRRRRWRLPHTDHPDAASR